jgi:predicted NBD/HSP70 family sugar kinase
LVDGECTPESTARQAKKLFDRMPEGIIENMERVGAVGVCLNGSVDHITGEVRCSHRMGWKNAAVKAAFEKEFGISAYIENDVKAGLIGEKVRMDIRDEVDTVYLYIGDEMGAAIVSNGMIVRGRQNDAGNIAGISINRNTEEKGMHLGMHLSESGLLQNAQKKDSGIASMDMLFDACRRGEAWAQELIRDFGYHFTKTVAVICGLFDPQKIIIGGGLVHKAAQYLGAEINDERICFGGAFEESCLSGAAVIALRSAVIERIGQSAE